jgi:hypothetical protein
VINLEPVYECPGQKFSNIAGDIEYGTAEKLGQSEHVDQSHVISNGVLFHRWK